MQFLRGKIPVAVQAGMEPPSGCHASLKPHQREICEWALRGGRRGVFASFGLGKTRMHLQLAAWITEWAAAQGLTGAAGKYLIAAPLGVRQEFTKNDGPAMGLRVEYVRTMAEAEASTARIVITNYERIRDGDIDPRKFAGAGLDEASVLRSFGSRLHHAFIALFAGVRFKFVFTATPSPNQYTELIHYGAFLGIMDKGQALTRFFQRDSQEAGNLTLYPHMEGEFWHWLRSWACFIQSPRDLGHDATGYDLPPLRVQWHRVEIDHTANWDGSHFDNFGQGGLFVDPAAGLQAAAAVKRDSIGLRVEKAREIMSAGAGEGRHWLLWHDLEAERHVIQREIPEAVSVWGNQDLEERERRIQAFAAGEISILSTKPVIAGSGCNFQRYCADAIFIGVGYKFNDFIQAVHRIYRFQQTREVTIHIVYLDTEDVIRDALEAKWRRHAELMETMTELLREQRLTPDADAVLRRTLGVNRREAVSAVKRGRREIPAEARRRGDFEEGGGESISISGAAGAVPAARPGALDRHGFTHGIQEGNCPGAAPVFS